VLEGVDVRVDEGAACTDQALSHIAFAALPDGRTCLGIQTVVAAVDRVGWTSIVKSLHLNIPNDLFNGSQRRLVTAQGERLFTSPPSADEVVELHSPWVSIDDRLGVVALFGGDGLRLDRSTQRRGGRYASLFVDELCLDVRSGAVRVLPGSLLVDVGFAVLAGANGKMTAAVTGGPLPLDGELLRGAWIVGVDGLRYGLAANFGAEVAETTIFGQLISLPAGEVRLVSAPTP